VSNPSDIQKFSFVGPSTIVSPTCACANGTQSDYKGLHEFLKAHEGEKILVTYEVAESIHSTDFPQLVWKERDPKNEGMCGPVSWVGYSGRWRIFTIHMSSFRGYDLHCYLPGIKEVPKSNTSEEVLKTDAQGIFEYWFERLLKGEPK